MYLKVFLWLTFVVIYSRGAEKYFRRGSRLNWPEGAVSRESIRAVNKLYCLKVYEISPLFALVATFYGVMTNAVLCRIWYLNT